METISISKHHALQHRHKLGADRQAGMQQAASLVPPPPLVSFGASWCSNPAVQHGVADTRSFHLPTPPLQSIS